MNVENTLESQLRFVVAQLFGGTDTQFIEGRLNFLQNSYKIYEVILLLCERMVD